jgi:phosphatidylserine/phosphatidylglycerophosphate/cardiolipin synthase-like enzyme
MEALQRVAERLSGEDGIRRLGQALWMMVGNPVDPKQLFWARSLVGADGDQLLWSALVECQAVSEADPTLKPAAVADLLCSLWGVGEARHEVARLIWTLPSQLKLVQIEDSYFRAARDLIDGATQRVMLISPYLEPKGIGRLLEPLIRALHRGVGVALITHGAELQSSLASLSIEELRRASSGLAGSFAVYSAVESEDVLLHVKLIIADSDRMIVGSANLTGKGLALNFEAGVLLGRSAATEAAAVVRALVASSLLVEVFRT